jgi:xanthine dehydrogenase YagS FAD-binding subunit
MDAAFPSCNKRAPGSGCGALEGINRQHAIFGASEHCIATHPSDICVALAALEATVRVRGPRGERSIPMSEFHRLPGDTPQIDTNLQDDELILSIDLPRSSYAEHWDYLKVRDRMSYEFALVSVAAALDANDQGQIRSARIVLGGVAHKPWRCETAEQMLEGEQMSAENFQAAADECVKGAKPYRDNAFKAEMAKRAVSQALRVAGGLA